MMFSCVRIIVRIGSLKVILKVIRKVMMVLMYFCRFCIWVMVLVRNLIRKGIIVGSISL